MDPCMSHLQPLKLLYSVRSDLLKANFHLETLQEAASSDQSEGTAKHLACCAVEHYVIFPCISAICFFCRVTPHSI